ncbi:hypothetical protein ACOBQB_09410 [Streptomyces sp. G5(2025)]|uniref:hypothetical protein n=1 Tax=Streptomyces sp. G5(2025) TaxID=3406628 RepID=UPI003C1B0052
MPRRGHQAVAAAGGHRDAASSTLATVLAPVSACAGVPQGAGFSEKLNRAAYTAGGLVAAGHLTADQARAALLAAAVHARPGQERRALQIIRSGMRAGDRHPLELGART